jgi:hypothetical protein
VTDQDADPLTGMQILVLHYEYDQGARQLTVVSTNSSNDQGDYRITNLSPGRY